MHTSCPAVTMGATGLRRLCGSWIWRLRPASERSARHRIFTRTRNRRNPSCAAGRSARSCCVRICQNKRRRFASARRLLDLQDIQIILAHAERYPAADIEQLARDGVPLQLNAACLTKPLHRKRYLTWIEDGCVRYLGSDIHMLGSGYQDWEKCARLLEKRVL